jgi:hypothetical protein
VNRAGDTDDKVIDISHESLIRQWNTLNQWVDEEGESASNYLQLAEATKLYKQKKKDLLTGSELQLALEWFEASKPSATWANRYKEGFEESINFLNASEAERIRSLNAEKKRKRKQQYLVYTVMGLLLIAAIAVIGVIMVNNKSIKKQNIANAVTIKALQEKEAARRDAEERTREKNIAVAKTDSINFYKMETDVYTLLEVQDPAPEQLRQMDSIARINPDSLKMRHRIEAIKNSALYKKAIQKTP